MKKFLLPLAAFALAASASAQTGSLVELPTAVYEDFPETFSLMMTNEPCMFRTSDNGAYAVGYEYEGAHASFMWTNETNNIEWLNPVLSDKNTGLVMACDVANDGTIAGAVVDDNLMLHPSIRTPKGEWLMLPMPDNWYQHWNYKFPQYGSVAKRISADGKLVCGYIYTQTAEGRLIWLPYFWYLNENFEVTGTKDFRNIGIEHAFTLYDMNDDGSIIVGMGENVRGEQLPVVIMNDKYTYLAGPELTEVGIYENGAFKDGTPFEETGYPLNSDGLPIYTDENGNKYVVEQDWDGNTTIVGKDENGNDINSDGEIVYKGYNYDLGDWDYYVLKVNYEGDTEQVTVFREYDENGNEVEFFWEKGGIVNCVDDDANIYYYYYDYSGNLYSFVENVLTGERKSYNSLVSCGTRGMVVGQGRILEGPEIYIGDLGTAMNVADDATVFAGVNVGSADGNGYNYPALLVFDESPLNGWTPDGVKAVAINPNKVSVDGGVLNIAGEYDSAEIFDASGLKIAEIAGSYNLNGLAAGLYIVKIQNNGTSYTHKVVK